MNRRNELAERFRDWNPPVELTRSSPREVRLTGAGVAMTVVAYVFMAGAVAAGATLWQLAQEEASRAKSLRDRGVIKDATITRLWHTGGDSQSYRVAYEFEQGGRTYRGQSRPPRRIWQRLREGDALPVRFLPDNPGVNRPVDWQKGPLPLWVPPLVAVMLAGGGALMTLVLHRQKQLLSEGRAAPAVVTRHSKGEHGKRVPHYEFPLLTGSIVRGKGGATRGVPAIGDTICILYDRDNPRRNTAYPMNLVRLPDIPRPRRL